MTTLTITPDTAKKRLKLAGTVASGEKVSVTVVGFGAVPTENLQLRVMAGHVAVGVFPLEDEDEWTVSGSGSDLTCTLNLSTEQAERLCKFGAKVCFVLEDTATPQLYGVSELTLVPWVKLAGVDVPVNLENYKVRISGLEETLNGHIENTENPHGVTKSQVGLGNVDNTSDMAKPVSTAQHDAIAALRTAMTEADDSLRSQINAKYAKPSGGIPASDLAGGIPASKLDSGVRTSLGKADTALQEHQDISGKADKSTTYTKAEVDEIVNALKTGSRVVVNSLPESGQPMAIYMVPKSSAQTNNSYDEYIWTAAGAWEKIGDTEIDLSGYYTKTAADDRFVQKETGKGLSTNDYTTAEKNKLAGVAAGATAVTVDSSFVANSTNPVQSKVVKAALDAKATGGVWSDWTISPDTYEGETVTVSPSGDGYWDLNFGDEIGVTEIPYDADASCLVFVYELGDAEVTRVTFVATRERLCPSASNVPPLADGTAAAGTSPDYARGDHRHPTDTTRAAVTDLRYAIIQVTPVISTTEEEDDTATVTLTDRALSRVTIGSAITRLVIVLPTRVPGYVRDFLLRLVITGEEAPNIVMQEADGTAPDFDVADDEWANIEPGVNILSFSETEEDAQA